MAALLLVAPFMFEPGAFLLIGERAKLALERLIVRVSVLHVLLESEFASELALAFRTLVHTLTA